MFLTSLVSWPETQPSIREHVVKHTEAPSIGQVLVRIPHRLNTIQPTAQHIQSLRSGEYLIKSMTHILQKPLPGVCYLIWTTISGEFQDAACTRQDTDVCCLLVLDATASGLPQVGSSRTLAALASRPRHVVSLFLI